MMLDTIIGKGKGVTIKASSGEEEVLKAGRDAFKLLNGLDRKSVV